MKAKLYGVLNGTKFRPYSKQSFTTFAKKPHPDQVPTTCYEMVVRKFLMYKLKQKKAKKIFKNLNVSSFKSYFYSTLS